MKNPYAPPPPAQEAEPRAAESLRRLDRETPQDRPPVPGGRGRPVRSRRRASPAEVRVISRRVFAAAGCALGALVTTALPLPWPALGVLLSIGALVLGVRAWLAVRGTNLTRSFMPVVAMSLVVGLLYLASSISVVITWPLQQERQDCLRQALTVSAHDACETDFREGLDRLRPDLS